MKLSRKFFGWIGCSAWLFGILVSGSMQAQEAAIPVAEVGPRSAELAASLRAIALRSDEKQVEQGPENGAAELRATVKALSQYSREVLAQPASPGSALELIGAWRPVVARLNRMQADLRGRASGLAVDVESLNKAERVWKSTAEAAEIQAAPAELRERIRANLQAIQNASSVSSKQLSSVLLLQNQLTDVQIEVDAVQEAIQKEAVRQRLGLLSFDSAPLWSLPALVHAAPSQQHVGPSLKQGRDQWMQDEALRILVRIALFLICLVLSYAGLRLLRRSLLRNGAFEGPGLQALWLILRRAWSSATFLSVMINAGIQTGIPSLLVSLGGLALAVPSLRLLPGLIGSNLYVPFYVLFALILGEAFVSSLPAGGLGNRFGWFALQVGASVFYAWLGVFLQRRATPGFWPISVRWLVWTSLCFSVLSALANLVGMVKLAEYILNSVLLISYAALLIRGASVICTELVLLANRSKALSAYVEARGGVEASARRASGLINTLAVVAFALAVLYALDLLTPFLAWADGKLSVNLHLGAIPINGYHLLAFVATLFFSYSISTIMRAGMEVSVFRHLGWQAGQKDAISKILHYAILMVGFLIALFAAGVDLSSVAVLMGGLSVGLGFGLQNILNNFVSGVILLFERPLQSGDLVTVGTTEGIVKDIGIRASVIATGDGADVIVPNGQLLSSSLTNWSQSDKSRRFDVKLSLANEVDPKKVMSILTEVAESNELVLRKPAPLALFTQFGGSSLEFHLQYWCHFANAGKLGTEIRMQIKEELANAGIAMPSSQTEIRIHGWDQGVESGRGRPSGPGQV